MPLACCIVTGVISVLLRQRVIDIEPVNSACIDIGIESLAHIGGQRREHVGRTGPSVGHMDDGKLNTVSLSSMRDLTETRKSGDAFILDYRRIVCGRFAGRTNGLRNGPSDLGFVRHERGFVGRAVGVFALDRGPQTCGR